MSDEPDKEYLKKLAEIDDQVRERLDQQFGQLRLIAIIGTVIVVLFLIGCRIFGGRKRAFGQKFSPFYFAAIAFILAQKSRWFTGDNQRRWVGRNIPGIDLGLS